MSFELPPLVAPHDVVAVDPIAEAVAEAEQIRGRAYEEGYLAGHAEALAAAAPAHEALYAAAAGLHELRTHVADGLERGSVDLALRIAEQVVGAALAADPDRVLEAIRGALRRIAERDRVHVLVHPEDLEIVRGGIDTLVDQLGGISSIDVQAERRVGRGGAIVRTADGDIDASLQTRLDRAREVLEREFADG